MRITRNKLTVLSTNGHPSYSKTYECSATINVNGITNKIELKAKVEVNGMSNILLLNFFFLKCVYVDVVD